MATLSYKRSRSPKQNLRWSFRHLLFGFAFVALLFIDKNYVTSDGGWLKAIAILGVLVNVVYVLGYIVIAVFWGALDKRSVVGQKFIKRSPPTIEDCDRWVQEAINEFKSTTVVAKQDQFALTGKTAKIVRTVRSGNSDRPEKFLFAVTIYAMNEAGEYFMFHKAMNSKPYTKHVSRPIAEKVLKLGNESIA
jgi:hypothetical protein